MRFRGAILTAAFICVANAQTLVDLKTQSRDIDFSGASTTKPYKSGTILPATCSVGEAFFRTNAVVGSNVYVCASLNSWTLEVGTPGPAGPAGPTGPQGPVGPQGPSGAVGRIQNSGVNLPVEPTLNFSSGGCSDDPVNGRTTCTGAGISGLNIAINGATQGTQPTLNLVSASGIIETCANNSGANRVDCTPAADTSFMLSRDTDQAGDDKTLLPSSASGTAYTYCPPHALTAYKQGQVFRLLPDVNSGISPTLNICTLGPIALRKNVSGTLTNITANDLTAATWYQLTAAGSPVTAFEVTPTNFTAPSYSYTAVAFSPTPAFTFGAGANTFKITLTGNVTSSTVAGNSAGQPAMWVICQDATGSHTFAWPANFFGAITIGSTPSKCNTQSFTNDGTNFYAVATGVINQ